MLKVKQNAIKRTITKIEDNLHADPDFVKVMKTARRKAAARGEECDASKRNCCFNRIHSKVGTDIKVKIKN
jgi:cytochrome c oxidase cbb3-type subunit I/II